MSEEKVIPIDDISLDPTIYDGGWNETLVQDHINRMNSTLHALQQNADNFYFIVLAILIFAIQIGFIFMEVGLVRTKNVTNVLLKCLLDAVLGAISYWLFGYAIAWGEGNSVVGWNNWAWSYLSADKLALAFNQLTFANSASTITSGSVAERLNLTSYYVYGVILTGFTYPFISRWGWYSSGWLKSLGFRDFGGSGIVHMFSGACALVAAIIIGPRAGRKDDKPISGHSLPFVGMGALLLILGLMGFNAASQLSLSKPGDGPIVTLSALNTLMSCSSGALTALFLQRLLPFFSGHWSYLTMINGALSGGVAICAGCGFMAPWAAVVTGIFAGATCIAARSLMEKFEIDDVVDAFAVHYCGGLVGLLTAPFLINPDGIFFAQNRASAVMLGSNVLGALVITGWAVLWSIALFGVLSWLGLFRLKLDEEYSGVDLTMHNEPAYWPKVWPPGDGNDNNPSVESVINNRANSH